MTTSTSRNSPRLWPQRMDYDTEDTQRPRPRWRTAPQDAAPTTGRNQTRQTAEGTVVKEGATADAAAKNEQAQGDDAAAAQQQREREKTKNTGEKQEEKRKRRVRAQSRQEREGKGSEDRRGRAERGRSSGE